MPEKVDCIFIDPPYNTGKEGWAYNDNVNSPFIKEWLGKIVDTEDMLRHDKWLCMMHPRLKLLHELLAANGSIWMTLDDNEIHRARSIMDEIFGEENFVANIVWNARESIQNDTDISTNNVNHILGYAKLRRRANRRLKTSNAMSWHLADGFVFLPSEVDVSRYANPDDDPRGPWKADPFDAPNIRENLTYKIINPNTNTPYLPPTGRCWRTEEHNYEKWLADNRILFGKKGTSGPQLKVFLSEKEEFGEIENNWWQGYSTTTNAIKFLAKILPGNSFDNPKPVQLIEKILLHTTRRDSIVLDSFGGSGTTAHAVLNLNRNDDGSRKFILVECEDYADGVTAERVRRVINGYKFKGTHKEELLRENLTWTKLKNSADLLHELEGIENLENTRFDRIKKEIKEGELIVTGEKEVTEKVEGLGGGFTYYTLGDPLDIDRLLMGKNLPSYAEISTWLFHTATGENLNPKGINESDNYLGKSSGYHVWLLYKPDLEYLKSKESALTLKLAETIGKKHKDKRHLVFAPARFVPNKDLIPLGVEFAPLPYALYRIEK